LPRGREYNMKNILIILIRYDGKEIWTNEIQQLEILMRKILWKVGFQQIKHLKQLRLKMNLIDFIVDVM